MIKFWQLLFSFIIISSCTISVAENIETKNWSEYSMTQKRPFYKNVNQDFYNSREVDFNFYYLFVNSSQVIGSRGIVFKWSDYTDSWNEFKANYDNLNLKVDMAISYNKISNVRWSNSSFSIPLKNITKNTSWIVIAQVDEKTSNGWRNDATHGQLAYAVWVSGDYVYIRFRLSAWASNNNDSYYFKVITKRVICNTTFDYNARIYSRLNQNVNNQTLNLKSDYSTSLQDERNILIEKTALDKLIQKALGEYYQLWKPFIADYAYNDMTNQAIVTVKFNDPNTNQAIRWDFKVTIKFTLSQEYWDRKFSQRFKIISGKVIDPNNPNGEMIEDKPLKWEDKDIYSTTATIRFDGAPNGSETMKVNGVPIQVIDNIFTFQMTDNQEHETNEYDILLEKHDLDDFNKILGKHEVNYVIKQDIPNLALKWYAWNPSVNPDQKKLVEPILPNGERNPNYDREVNPKTGTKNQIMWVKHEAENPFPLDPLDKNGDRIIDNKFDEGFLAEGSVSGMGIVQSFNDSWIKSVQRVKVDEKTLLPKGPLETIKNDNNGSYFSLSGTYLYILTDQKGHTSNKFVIIGQQWNEKYAKFLDVLDNPRIAVPFWSTLQGFHLKNYLAKYKFLNSKDIQNLTFEQVSSYWKEYVSDVKTQHITPDDNPGIIFDLKNIEFETIKMNKTTITEIRKEIIEQIQKQLTGTNLVYDVDYQLKSLTDENLQKLLNYDSKGNATITLNIIALHTSTRIIGNNKIKIMNNIHYDPKNVIDLNKIKFKTQRFNFSKFSVDKLKEWIFQNIDQTFTSYKISLIYLDDYGVKPLDEKTLKQFLTSKKSVSLIFNIYSQDESVRTKNSTNLELINDPNAAIAPSEPLDPAPNPLPPDNKNSWISKKESLIIMTIISILIVGSLAIIVFFKYRLRKGIGVKKIKNRKLD